MFRKIIYAAILTALTAIFTFAQTPAPMPTPQPSPTPVSLKTILTKAEKQTIAYRENFANLLAEEAKVFEKYDKKGKAGDKRTVESNFLVYQSAKDANSISEYRNVTRVDGKTVGDNEKRAEDFFEKVLKSTTADKELERIREENSRYDKNLVINGITLNQAVILAAHIRPFFDFKIVGREQFEGREMFVVSYQQKSKSPYISVNEDNKSDKLFIEFDVDTPGSVKELGALLRGELWIDTETFDVWRERRELTVQPNGAANPFVVIEISFDYQKSENIGITPKRIVLINYALKRKDEELKVLKQTQATFEYTKFTRSDVEVKSGEVNSTKENQ
ncbi:MAG: hypothetical protein H0X72_17295 [Acidobacteria bacterium]|jgi:hypothetical protein|nr:hypothetical protein [Acidobacteriota bacterium]